MQTIVRILVLLGTLVAVGLMLWISITVIGFFLIAGAVIVLGYALRQFLIDKGILNPRPGVPTEEKTSAENITIIETNYTRIDSDSER